MGSGFRSVLKFSLLDTTYLLPHPWSYCRKAKRSCMSGLVATSGSTRPSRYMHCHIAVIWRCSPATQTDQIILTYARQTGKGIILDDEALTSFYPSSTIAVTWAKRVKTVVKLDLSIF
jgi:hypothetical protein